MIPGKMQITANFRASFYISNFVSICCYSCEQMHMDHVARKSVFGVLANNKCADEPAHPHSRLRKGEQKT